jgi:methionine--tRNA ligase beta chain
MAHDAPTGPIAASPTQSTPVVAAGAAGPLPNIAYDLFAKLDLRVATIVSAEPHPNADKLLKIRLDDGTPEGRQVCAGIKAWYDPASLVGKQVVIVANLEPRQLRGEISQGMILAASDLKENTAPAAEPTVKSAGKPGADERDVVVLTVQRPVKPGSKVS